MLLKHTSMLLCLKFGMKYESWVEYKYYCWNGMHKWSNNCPSKESRFSVFKCHKHNTMTWRPQLLVSFSLHLTLKLRMKCIKFCAISTFKVSGHSRNNFCVSCLGLVVLHFVLCFLFIFLNVAKNNTQEIVHAS